MSEPNRLDSILRKHDDDLTHDDVLYVMRVFSDRICDQHQRNKTILDENEQLALMLGRRATERIEELARFDRAFATMGEREAELLEENAQLKAQLVDADQVTCATCLSEGLMSHLEPCNSCNDHYDQWEFSEAPS
jgi:hypothetical protein